MAPSPSPVVKPRAEQPWPIRLSHWLNVPVLAILAGSGLQILAAYPQMGPRGALYRWYPFQGWIPPAWLRLGGWLAGARALHFSLGWVFMVNGLLYAGYFFWSGEWRRRAFFPARDTGNAVQSALHYAHLRKTAPRQGFYNGLQRLGYTSALLLGVLVVASGLGMWKPTQLWWVAAPFGGYDGARVVHLFALAALAFFTLGHVLMVVLHPKTFPPMVTGGETRARAEDFQ